MKLLTLNATVSCDHRARVSLVANQTFVKISGSPVLTEPDPVGRSIGGCPNAGANIKPCTRTHKVSSGYSGLIRIAGRSVVLNTLIGLTDGTPPASVTYRARSAGQEFVMEL